METYEIVLMDLNSSALVPVTVIQRESASTGEFILEVTVNGIPYQGVSEFFFPAFQILRDELLSVGYGMNCCSALVNAHQSPMVSVCDKVYLLTLGQKALRKDMVCIFDPATPENYPDTIHQNAFTEAWHRSLQSPAKD